MKTVIKVLIVSVLLAAFAVTNAQEDDSSSRDRGGRRHGPPPEAYTACEGKSAGDAASFVSPHGDTVTGTCEQEGDQLVLAPDQPPRGGSGGGRGNGDRE